MYAKIENGKVKALSQRPLWVDTDGNAVSDAVLKEYGYLPVEDTPPAFDEATHSSLRNEFANWIVSDSVVQMTYTVSPLPFQVMQQAALDRINAGYCARVAGLSAGYPEDEQKSWAVQIEESKAYRADPTATTPWIDAAAAARGISKAALVALITEQDAQYRQISGSLTGRRQALRDEIYAVPQGGDAGAALAAINWPDEADEKHPQ